MSFEINWPLDCSTAAVHQQISSKSAKKKDLRAHGQGKKSRENVASKTHCGRWQHYTTSPRRRVVVMHAHVVQKLLGFQKLPLILNNFVAGKKCRENVAWNALW